MKASTKRRLALTLLAALTAGSSLIASREASSAPCSGSVDESRRHMERGFSLYDKKHFIEAAAEFDAAYRAQPFSAFLCNAAMAYQEALDFPNAILRYKAFLVAEPNPPDLAKIKSMLAWLEAQNAAQIAAHASSDAGAPEDAGASASEPPPPFEMSRSFRSQIIVVSEPANAPLNVFVRRVGSAPFVPGGTNPGWEKLISGVRTPHDLSLGAGSYHIVIDAFKDYKRSETDIDLAPGHLYEFKANLSQGEFMGFLRVLSPAAHARVFLDDPPPHKKPPWGIAPHGSLVETGSHDLWIEAPGYETANEKVVLEHGRTIEITPALTRVAHGYLRVDGNADEIAVRIDGVRRGVYTPLGEPLRLRLAGGPHHLELEADGRKTYSGDIDVPRGQELGVHGRLSFKPARSGTVAMGALAVGAIIGGVALFEQAAQPRTVGPGMAPSPAPTYLRVGGAVSFGVGALLGFSTVYTLVRDTSPPSRVQLDKPKDLDEDEDAVETPVTLPKARGRLFGGSGAAECGAL